MKQQTQTTEKPQAPPSTETPKPEENAASQSTQAAQSEEKPQAKPERIRDFERGPIERTMSRMIAGWLKTERDRGYLTPQCEDDAQKAIEQLATV